MATPRIARTLTCPNCFGRLPTVRPAAAPIFSSSPALPWALNQTQVRYARSLSKAELEDLQGIPVRLLRDVAGFGRKHAIIRVKAGRMRNIFHPKGAAEYMTKKRFDELGITEAAIGVRDRSFGTQLPVDEAEKDKRKNVVAEVRKKETISLPPQESRALLDSLLPETLIFPRKPIGTAAAPQPAAPAEPAIPRSPSLAINAAISAQAAPQGAADPAASTEPATPAAVAIFGSVAVSDVLAHVRQALLNDQNGNRVALEAENISILGLESGEDRIKRLGRFEVEIVTGKGVEGLKRVIEVVADQE
ncbi:hypothetical protein BX600DRAFT_474198 [Xylariales sp. PMI_506]|nr:hypothetical protein BX600DRAFT_474198 [Xylariales sp. PMI_506]